MSLNKLKNVRYKVILCCEWGNKEWTPFLHEKHGNAIWFWWTLMITRLHLENNIWHKVVIFVWETSYKYIIKIYTMLTYMVFILDNVTWWVVAQEEILSICTSHEKIISTLCPSSWKYTQRLGYCSVAIVKWPKKIYFVVAYWIETTN